jgi:hypothetical protein
VNERMRILQLLQAGKITLEQADELLAALESRAHKSAARHSDRWGLGDLKHLGTQISSAVSQSLSEVRKVIEQQTDHWNFGWMGQVIGATHELELEPNIVSVAAETTNGRIQVASWSEPFVRVHVRGQVKTNRLNEARETLARAVQTDTREGRLNLAVVHGKWYSDSGAQVVGAHLDIYVPRTMKQLLLRTQNGGVYIDSIQAEELDGDTVNGSINHLSSCAERIQLNTENGRIEIRDSVRQGARHVYAFTKNGTLTMEGISDEVQVKGIARTSFGRIDVSDTDFDVEADDSARPTLVRFRQKASVAGTDEVHVQLETKNGSVRILK